MVQWKLYLTPDGHKRYMSPKNSTKDMNMIEHTCVLTGEKFKSRGKFWKYIEDSKLDPDTMTYDKKATCENTDLMDKSHLKWLWTHYFKEKGTKKNLQNLLGSINLELYIILLKVYKGEMDIDECLNDNDEEIKGKNIISNNKNSNTVRMNNKSPLRYPGGKTRACKILDEIFKEHFNIELCDNIVSPFFGGGSFEFFLQNNYGLKLIVNDKFKPLFSFWEQCKKNNNELTKELIEYYKKGIDKDIFKNLREKIMSTDNQLQQAVYYFIINRCSFSGATLSGGFSEQSSKGRFTESSIERIRDLNMKEIIIKNLDFSDFMEQSVNSKSIIFLDPPYYLGEKSRLYGNNGDMHEGFNHKMLYDNIIKYDKWIITYNNCEHIRLLYKDYTIIEVDWKYGMNKSKKSSEIVIIKY